MSLSSNIAPILEYATMLMMAIIFTAFALSIKEGFWATALKVTAAMFWFVMAIGQFIFFGVDSSFLVLSLPYTIFGLLFFISILRDSLSEKKHRAWDFEDD